MGSDAALEALSTSLFTGLTPHVVSEKLLLPLCRSGEKRRYRHWSARPWSCVQPVVSLLFVLCAGQWRSSGILGDRR